MEFSILNPQANSGERGYHMTTGAAKDRWRTIIDRKKLMINTEGCPACGLKFNLGEPVVYACGTWGREPKLIHESDAVFDSETQIFMERECSEEQRPA
jgi:hypothetical protein